MGASCHDVGIYAIGDNPELDVGGIGGAAQIRVGIARVAIGYHLVNRRIGIHQHHLLPRWNT